MCGIAIGMFFLGNSSKYDKRRKRRSSPAFVVSEPERHVYIIGKSGSGKSQTLLSILTHTIRGGYGCAFIDPHGETAEQLLSYIPKWRRKDVVYFNPADTEYPLGFNPIKDPNATVDALHSIWAESWGPQLEMFLNAACLALSELPDGTLLGINKLLTDGAYRKRVKARITDIGVRHFWYREFEYMPDRERRDRTLSTLNKIGQLITDPTLRNIVGQPRTSFKLRDNTILICNLSQGKLGIRKSSLLASLLLAHIHSWALKRKYTNFLFSVVLDEFQLYGSITLSEMLSGVRKFGVPLILANQSLTQLPKSLTSAILANTHTVMAFQTGIEDAKTLEPLFSEDTTALYPHTALVRMGSEITRLDVPLFQAKRRSTRAIIARCRALSPGRAAVEARLSRFLA